ncbi:MAG: 4-(cytidine 5'-diphospho)-2-C-methyl-D-erythritol kinase, partial [Hyphomicrobiaceae bacterium]
VVEPAPEKINLTLSVIGRRSDGYHHLQSLIAFAMDAADRLTLDTDGPAGFTVTGPTAAAIVGENLVQVALERLAAMTPRLRLGQVVLEKHLPVAAGIGGGSSDAAALLRAVRAVNPELAAQLDWDGLALELGADVPVCLGLTSAWVEGIGEQITPVDVPPLPAVLATPASAGSPDKTRRVFSALAASGWEPRAAAPGADNRPSIGGRDALIRLIEQTGNDLAQPAFAVLPAALQAMTAVSGLPGCIVARLSGAGPTVFGIFGDEVAAKQAAARLAHQHPSWWVRDVTIGGQGRWSGERSAL